MSWILPSILTLPGKRCEYMTVNVSPDALFTFVVPLLVAISHQQHVPWSQRGWKGWDSAAPRLTACSGWISPSAPLFHKGLADLVCSVFSGAYSDWYFDWKVISLRLKIPAGKTLYSTETSVLIQQHPFSRDSAAACWNVLYCGWFPDSVIHCSTTLISFHIPSHFLLNKSLQHFLNIKGIF